MENTYPHQKKKPTNHHPLPPKNPHTYKKKKNQPEYNPFDHYGLALHDNIPLGIPKHPLFPRKQT